MKEREKEMPLYPEVSSTLCRLVEMHFDPCVNPFSCNLSGIRKD